MELPRNARIWMVLAAFALGGMFVLPLWHIGLVAPQYPEGLGMEIRIHTVAGTGPHDLDNINKLNHYIGMQAIDPAAIPELRVLPWVVGALIVLALATALWRKRSWVVAWLVSMSALGIAGIADFWRWMYDYGHNLDLDNAVIKVPGAVYQPPLVGTKQILNFVATSRPGLGAWCAVLAAICGGVAFWLARRRRIGALAVIVAGVAGCSTGPKAIAYGEENCGFCGMTISDARFGAQFISSHGKIQTFDSGECLASYYLAQDSNSVRNATVWVANFYDPGTFLPATEARYIYGATRVRSPMGHGLLALATNADAENIARELNGTVLSWQDLLDTIAARAALNRRPSSAAESVEPRGAIHVNPASATPTIAMAIARAHPGDRIVVAPGLYREPTIVVDKPLTIEGMPGAVLDGESVRELLVVTADDVTIRGLHLRNVGRSSVDDLAAIKVLDAKNCVIEHNRIENGFYGIYLARASACHVNHNTILGQATTEVSSGNGIHLWSVDSTVITGNIIRGHRDGIYFEFVKNAEVRKNLSERNVRYGLHFMYSDDCQYQGNVFRHNTAGVAVMYTRRVVMTDNRFEDNWGAASYGLLFKEIVDSRVEHNVFARNTVGLMADGANRIIARHNEFRHNGWAVRIVANTDDGQFVQNNFAGNTFDVAIQGGEPRVHFAGNYWSAYRGYDLNRDGVGDVPFHPVRLFSLVVARHPPALILLRSAFVQTLDAAERMLPVLTPAALADETPAMRPLS